MYEKNGFPAVVETAFLPFVRPFFFFSAFLSAAYSSLTFCNTAGVMLSVVSASISAEALMMSLYFLSALICCTARLSRSCARFVKT